MTWIISFWYITKSKFARKVPKRQVTNLALYYIMADRAFVIAKELFYRRDGNIFTLWEWLNDEKQFFWFKFNYIKKHLYRY